MITQKDIDDADDAMQLYCLCNNMMDELLALRKVADAVVKMRDNRNALSFAVKAELKEAGR